MTRKATDQVTTIGIRKNNFHLIGLDGRSGSWLCGNAGHEYLGHCAVDQGDEGIGPSVRFC